MCRQGFNPGALADAPTCMYRPHLGTPNTPRGLVRDTNGENHEEGNNYDSKLSEPLKNDKVYFPSLPALFTVDNDQRGWPASGLFFELLGLRRMGFGVESTGVSHPLQTGEGSQLAAVRSTLCLRHIRPRAREKSLLQRLQVPKSRRGRHETSAVPLGRDRAADSPISFKS